MLIDARTISKQKTQISTKQDVCIFHALPNDGPPSTSLFLTLNNSKENNNNFPRNIPQNRLDARISHTFANSTRLEFDHTEFFEGIQNALKIQAQQKTKVAGSFAKVEKWHIPQLAVEINCWTFMKWLSACIWSFQAPEVLMFSFFFVHCRDSMLGSHVTCHNGTKVGWSLSTHEALKHLLKGSSLQFSLYSYRVGEVSYKAFQWNEPTLPPFTNYSLKPLKNKGDYRLSEVAMLSRSGAEGWQLEIFL